MTKAEYVAALRELADFVEKREWPEKLQRYYGTYDTFDLPSLSFEAYNKIEFGLLCTSLGSFEKTRNEYYTGAVTTLPSGVKVTVSTSRDTVCRKIVIGKKVIPAKLIEAQVIPEHEEDIVEWECPESFIALSKTEGI